MRNNVDILTFEVGEFLYTATDEKVKFAKFEPVGKPFLWRPKIPEEPTKKKGKLGNFLERLFEALTFSETSEPIETQTDEELEQEDEETLGLLGEPDEDW